MLLLTDTVSTSELLPPCRAKQMPTAVETLHVHGFATHAGTSIISAATLNSPCCLLFGYGRPSALVYTGNTSSVALRTLLPPWRTVSRFSSLSATEIEKPLTGAVQDVCATERRHEEASYQRLTHCRALSLHLLLNEAQNYENKLQTNRRSPMRTPRCRSEARVPECSRSPADT